MNNNNEIIIDLKDYKSIFKHVGKIDGKWGPKSQAGFDEMLSVNGKMAKVKVQINGVTVLNGEY